MQQIVGRAPLSTALKSAGNGELHAGRLWNSEWQILHAIRQSIIRDRHLLKNVRLLATPAHGA